MNFDHKRYVVVGTNDEAAEAIKLLLGGVLGRHSTVIEVDELTSDEVQILSEHVKDKLLEQYSVLY